MTHLWTAGEAASPEPPSLAASSVWSSSESDSDAEEEAGAAALVLRRHGSLTAAVARALVRVRFLHEERESLQQRLQVRPLVPVAEYKRRTPQSMLQLIYTRPGK